MNRPLFEELRVVDCCMWCVLFRNDVGQGIRMDTQGLFYTSQRRVKTGYAAPVAVIYFVIHTLGMHMCYCGPVKLHVFVMPRPKVGQHRTRKWLLDAMMSDRRPISGISKVDESTEKDRQPMEKNTVNERCSTILRTLR